VDDAVLLCSIYTLLFICAVDLVYTEPALRPRSRPIVVFLAIALLFAVTSPFAPSTGTYYFLFTLPTLVAAFYLATRCTSSSVVQWGFFGLLIACMAIFALSSWNGGGRLVLAAALAYAFLIASYSLPKYLGPWIFVLLMGSGSLIGTLARFGGVTVVNFFALVKRDSSFFPILKLQEVLQVTPVFHNDFRGIFDQFLLFFLAPVPRVLWPSKPNGFGFAYTVDNYVQGYIDSGYSIAATFVGEHVYYLGSPLFYVSTLLTLGILIVAIQVIHRSPGEYQLLGVAILIYLPTFFWGGMAVFSARVLIGVPLLLVFAVLMRDRAPASRSAPTD
jgi:hypothetical protein